MNEVGGQQPEETIPVEENGSKDLREPEMKRANFGTPSEFFLEQKTNQIVVSNYYEQIDPSQPSTSSLPLPQILQLNGRLHFPTNNPPTLTAAAAQAQRNRLRAPRNTSIAVAEAAQKNGMQTINRSGSRFVVPITMQAHPTPITDRILDEKDDILSQHEAYPYCCLCHCIIKTWRGFEYHVLRTHIKYRAFRCYHCQKESFFTEEEGRFHLSIHHPSEETILLKEFDMTKETAARNAFKHIFLMCRDGPLVTKERISQWENESAQQIMKFPFLRFKRPVVLVKKAPTSVKEAQTEVTTLPIVVEPVIGRSGRLYHNVPLDFHHIAPQCEYQQAPLRPRSTATLHDEDPRDREKRVAALMHAVHTSQD